MATFIRHTACKRCGSSDANAVYSDDSEYCFSCQYTSSAKKAAWVSDEETESVPTLPDDCSTNFPQAVVDFLKPTGITLAELIKNDYTYSQKSTHQLIRLLENQSFECRAVGGVHRGPKTRFYGSKQHTLGDVRSPRGGRDVSPFQSVWDERETYSVSPSVGCLRTGANRSLLLPVEHAVQQGASCQEEAAGVQQSLCLVEDSLSAIKVGRVCDAVPLFGSSINNEKLTRVVNNYQKVYVWLDEDKFTTAQSIALRCQLIGVDAKVIYSKLDPKFLDASDYLK